MLKWEEEGYRGQKERKMRKDPSNLFAMVKINMEFISVLLLNHFKVKHDLQTEVFLY